MPTDIESIIQDSIDFMESVSDTLVTRYSAGGDVVVDAVMKMLSSEATKGVLNVSASERAKILNKVSDAILKGYQKAEIPQSVNDFIRSFDRIAANSQKIQNILNGLDIPDSLTEPLITTYAGFTKDMLLKAGVSIDLEQPIKNIVLANLVSGATLNQAEKSLREFIASNAESVGKMESMASQVARDLTFQLNGAIDSAIQKEYEMNAIRFVGSIKPGTHKKLKNGKRSKSITNESRLQCKRMVSVGVILMSELPYWINFGYTQGSGMIKGTTPDNYLVYRNGWNCRHLAIPFIKK